MHDLPFWTGAACILAERSRSAPQALRNPLAMAALAQSALPSLSRPVALNKYTTCNTTCYTIKSYKRTRYCVPHSLCTRVQPIPAA
eukprot:6211071-Pleurochrysis_carterae.AAC.1